MLFVCKRLAETKGDYAVPVMKYITLPDNPFCAVSPAGSLGADTDIYDEEDACE